MTTFVPHTLTEQIALITAEAEGRKVRFADDADKRHTRAIGFWRFDLYRYEVEQPLMEEWRVVDKSGSLWGSYTSQPEAMSAVPNYDKTEKHYAPFRVVHMREVRATQGPTP